MKFETGAGLQIRIPRGDTGLEDAMAGRSARYKAKLKAKKMKERARKGGYLKKRKPGGRMKKLRGAHLAH